MPFTANVHDEPALFGRFRAIWTPTVVIASLKGEERYRIEGYVPRDALQAQLAMGLGRVAFVAKQWEVAERWFDHLAAQHPDSDLTPEALYWRAVCQYSQEHKQEPLVSVATELRESHPDSLWLG